MIEPKMKTLGKWVNLQAVHPEVINRGNHLFEMLPKNALAVTSGARTYAAQKHLYTLRQQGKYPHMVADPDRQWPSGEGVGSYHMVQHTGYSYALDIVVNRKLCSYSQLHAAGAECGVAFHIPSEPWHATCSEPGTLEDWLEQDEFLPWDSWENKDGKESPKEKLWRLRQMTDLTRYSYLKREKKPEFKERVKMAQQILAANGYYPPTWVDGLFGPKTERAVRRWQRDKGLTVDGVIGPKTWESLTSVLNHLGKVK